MINSMRHKAIIAILILLLIPSLSGFANAEPIILDFFYSESCGTCLPFKEQIISDFKDNPEYDDFLTVNIKDVDNEKFHDEWRDEYDYYPYPFVIIFSPYQESEIIGEFEITTAFLSDVIYEFYFNTDIIPTINSSQMLTGELYYSEPCLSCEAYFSLYNQIEQNYSGNFTFIMQNIDENVSALQTYQQIINNSNKSFSEPLLVFYENSSLLCIVEEQNITKVSTYVHNALKEFVTKIDPSDDDDSIIHTPFGPIDLKAWSLPVLTIILGGIDSFNPCAFFILIFLLNLLIYAKSRRRMLLIGGIFIFFSGLLYMVFMFFLYGLFRQLQTNPATLLIITIAVGAIVLPMGLLNIKDFFYFKKGASLSIPDSKKPKIYKKMRDLVKNPKLGATILGTVVLAGTVNFYELLCTLGLPFAFTKALTNFNSISADSATYYFYIILYNVVYVIPLFVIVLIFVITLGKRKLTEWHGQIMKLVSGLMLTMFGIIFLTNYQLLENVITPILLLLISVTATAIIAFLYKKYVGIPEESDK